MIVIGLDSAEHTGFAVVESTGPRERLVQHGTFRVRRAGDVEQAVAALAPLRPDLVAIEGVYVAANAATALTLAILLGRWLQAWERRGIECTTVTAATWQPAILSGLIGQRSPREDRKRAAVIWASGTFGGVTLPEDEADAAGIATWAARQALMKARERRAGAR